jgi:hypothetical protein
MLNIWVNLERERYNLVAGCWWLMPIILATQEAKIRWNTIEASPGKKLRRPYTKKSITKKGWWSGSNGRIQDWRYDSSSRATCFASVKLWVQTPVPQKKKVEYIREEDITADIYVQWSCKKKRKYFGFVIPKPYSKEEWFLRHSKDSWGLETLCPSMMAHSII